MNTIYFFIYISHIFKCLSCWCLSIASLYLPTLRSLIGPSPGDQYVRSSKGFTPWNSNDKTNEKNHGKTVGNLWLVVIIFNGLVVIIFNVFCFFWCFYISTLIKTKHSMGGSCIYLREWFIFMINVGKYTIHSVFGLEWTYWTPKPLLVGLVWNTGEKSKSHFLKNLPSLFWSFFEMWAFLFGSEPIYLPPECFQPLQMSQVPQPPPFCPEIRSFSPRPYLTSIVTTRRTFLMWLGRLRVFWGECCESTRIFYLKTILNIVDGRNPAPPEMYKTL